MRRLRHLKKHAEVHEGGPDLAFLALMVLSFIIFDGIIMYLAPIVMHRSGMTLGRVGLVLGLSSVAGMLFDVVLLRLLQRSTYRRIFLFMFLVAATVPFFLFGGNTVTGYLLAMAMWGLYYNLYDIGTLDFVGRTTVPERHTSSFGILKVSEGLGYLIAPFVASLFLVAFSAVKGVPPGVFGFLVVGFVFYLLLCGAKVRRGKEKPSERKDFYGMLTEMRMWKKVGSAIVPLLTLTLVINLVDAAVWTIGPIFSESLKLPAGLSGGSFMLAYTLPPLFVGWIVGSIVARFGKRNTAFFALLFGSALLVLIRTTTVLAVVIAVIFCVSFFFAVVWPTLDAAYADEISASPAYHEEIETINDLFTNVGDTVGPIIGGYAAQYLDIRNAFVLIGVFGVMAALYLLIRSPKRLSAGIAS